MYVIDSAEQIILLPVTRASLDDPERTDKALGLVNNFSVGYYDYGGSMLYNNLVVSYEKTGASVVLFKKRFGIIEIEFVEESGQHFIVGRGCDKDSNKDKLLNSQDLQKVFVYNVSEQKLSFVDMPANYGAINIYSQDNLEMQLCKFGVDRNEDGEYDDLQEPAMLMKIDLLEAKLQSFVSEEDVTTLQNVLEGK